MARRLCAQVHVDAIGVVEPPADAYPPPPIWSLRASHRASFYVIAAIQTPTQKTWARLVGRQWLAVEDEHSDQVLRGRLAGAAVGKG